MKKALLSTSFLFLVFSGFGQAFNAAEAAREVDSLIQVSRDWTAGREFEKALETIARAEDLALNLLGEETEAYGNVCFQYGNVFYAKGNHPEAEQWYLQSKAIREKVLGKEHPDYAASLHTLGVVYYHMGNNYENAELHHLEAKAIREKTLGKEHVDYAATMNALGNLYYVTGNIELAESCYLEALAIREKILGKENILYSGTLHNLANVSKAKGDYEKAENYYKENISIIEKTNGKENHYYGGGLFGLANLYFAWGKYQKSEWLSLESKRILERLPNYSEIPSYMSCIELLGMVYYETGRYEQSEAFHLKAKFLRGSILGKEHLSYEMSLAKLSELYWKMGKYENAAQHFTEAADMRRTLLSDASRHLSEKEVFSFITTFENDLDKHYSFANDFSSAVPFFSGVCFDNTLFHKGFLLNTSYHLRNLNTSKPELAEKFDRLKSFQKLLSAEYAKPLSGRDAAGVTDLEATVNALEKDLARTVAGYGEAIRQIDWREVQSALRPGEAVIEFVHFKYYKPEPTDSVMYAALLLMPGMTHPLFIPLFEERELEFQLPPADQNRAEYVNRLYQDKRLTQLIWSPIDPFLNGVSTIYCSLSGLLHRIHIAALPSGANEIIADRIDIVILGSARQLVREAGQREGNVNDAVIFGDIQYEMDSTAIAPGGQDGLAGQTRGISFTDTDPNLRGGAWKFLKHSEKEVAGIAATLQKAGIPAILRKGYSATEEAFKNIGRNAPSPRILHLSTHGYFFPDPGARQTGKQNEPVFKHSEHPMIRSGLIMAGGNHAWQTGMPLGNREDGILTAYEISQMNLSNTELVVLSACETGLGDIRGNEGVYGLQRAFKIAGAKNLIMSLWQVPDYQTQELMTAFYQKWLLDKLPVHQALEAAQIEMEDKGYEPYYWAGWVLVE